MLRLSFHVLVAAGCVAGMSACSNTGDLPGSILTTSSIDQQKTAKAPAIDPTCVSLVSKIDGLRKDGITDRVAKAGAGKSKTVPVYRSSLARMAELDRTNAQYQARCGTLKPTTAGVVTPTSTSATTAATNAAISTAQRVATNAATTAATNAVSSSATSATETVKTIAKAKATDAVKKAATNAVVNNALAN